MKETLNTVRVGLFFLLGLAVTWIVYETLQQGRLVRDETYPLYGSFADVKMLRSGDDVRVAGVRVGRVADVHLDNGEAEAVLHINKEVTIARDSVAIIAISSVLGGNHVAIEMGRFVEEPLSPGDTIATRHTPDLNEVFVQLGKVTGRVDELFDDVGALLASVTGTPEEPGAIQNLNAIITENREALNASMANIREITEKVNRGEGTISRLINDDDAYENLIAAVEGISRASEGVSSLMDDASEVVAHVRGGQGSLGSLIYGEELGREIEAIAANLREVSDQLAKGEGTLGRLLVDDTLYQDIQALMQRADRALEGLGEQGPITAVGVTAGALF